MLALHREDLRYNRSIDHQIELHKLLNRKIYADRIKAADHKEQLEGYIKKIDKLQALHKNFIWYGNQSATSFVIIDIDKQPYPLDQYKNFVKKKLGLRPSWILQSRRGYQVGFILDRPIFYSNRQELQKLSDLKINLTLLLEADQNGSLRNYGYWRNPLTHKAHLNPKEFNIYELHHKISQIYYSTQSRFTISDVIDIPKKTPTIKELTEQKESLKNWDHISTKGFHKGNRNNFLFITAVKLLYQGRIKNHEILATLTHINKNQLPIPEVQRIARSIASYNITPNSKRDTVEAIYQRGQYSDDLFNHQIHNYKKDGHMIYERQRIGQRITSAKRIVKTIQILQEAYFKAYKNNKIVKNKTIAEFSAKSVRTIQRYRQYKKQIAAAAFKRYLNSITPKEAISPAGNVIANVTPLKELLNLALQDTVFIASKLLKVFRFVIDDDLEVQFIPSGEDIPLM